MNPHPPTEIEAFATEIRRVSAPNLLGYYNCCEVTEVLGFAKDSPNEPINVFSIIAFEERTNALTEQPRFLNSDRIIISLFRNWFFGVYRYFITPDNLNSALLEFGRNGVWRLSGNVLKTGPLFPTRPQFVPPDATESPALNRILKNNFWNGSYVFELFDHKKELVASFIEKPPRLQQLSEAIQKIVPLRLASVADRLGNILIQLPIRILMCEFGFMEDRGMSASMAWDKRVQPRACRVVSMMEFDGTVHGFGISEVSGEYNEIVTGDSSQINRNMLWDDNHRLILAASGPVAALREINISMMPVETEPRQVVIRHSDDSVNTYRVQLFNKPIESRVGTSDSFAYRQFIHQRLYAEERRRLEHERTFVQYGLIADKQAERQRALEDIRYLLNTHGREGAWLWDPYLSYEDLMQTLFFCKYHSVELRALAAFEARTRRNTEEAALNDSCFSICTFIISLFRAKREPFTFEDWRHQQYNGFKTAGNNYHGLNLEFRSRHGNVGWSFHDRFLIFPRAKQRPQAWSLGTSINSLGGRHHVLQRVDNGQMIADAFLELWNQLNGPDYLVWKCP